MSLKRIYIVVIFCLCSMCMTYAQIVKHIEVEEGQPYVDHVSLQKGSKDTDILIKFNFDEPSNSLTVSLISYKKLFVFQSNVRYSRTYKWYKLKPSKLPYAVESDELARYKYMRPVRKATKRKQILKRWISTDGLQPQPYEYKMVNDYIEQKFDILYKEKDVTVNLHDILVMDEIKKKHNKKKYELYFRTDLNRTYEIKIKRNPCFGKEELILAAKERVENLQNAFNSFNDLFGKDAGPADINKVSMFNEMKSFLEEQYPFWEEKSSCPSIQANIDAYNVLVNSISSMDYRPIKKAIPLDLGTNYILQMARKIDNNVNRWRLSNDKIEKKDLELECNDIIRKITSHINRAETMDGKQASAVQVFRKAEYFFQNTCVKK